MDDRAEIQEANFIQKLYLSESVEAFSQLPESQKSVLSDLFTCCVSRSFGLYAGGLDVCLVSTIGSENEDGIQPQLTRNIRPDTTILLSLLPKTSGFTFSMDEMLKKVGCYYAACGVPVLSAKVKATQHTISPILFSLDIAGKTASQCYFERSRYEVFLINIENTILAECELFYKIDCLKGKGLTLYIDKVRQSYDYGAILYFANAYGYKVAVDADLFRRNMSNKSYVCIISEEEAEVLKAELNGLINCSVAIMEKESGPAVVTIQGKTEHISSLLIGDVILKAVKYKNFEEGAHAESIDILPNVSGKSTKYTTIHEVLGDVELFSNSLLRSHFDSSTGFYKTNTESNHSSSYFSFEGTGRYMASLDSFVSGEFQGTAAESTLRIVLAHEAYGAEPVLGVLRVLESSTASHAARAILKEIKRTFEVLAIDCRIEREVVQDLNAEFVVAVGLISKIATNISPVMGGFKMKGDLIYKVDLFKEQSGSKERLEDSEDLQGSKRLVADLVGSGLVNAMTPILRGGLFFALYSMSVAHNLGFDITGDDEIPLTDFLLADSIGKAVVAVSPEQEGAFVDYIKDAGIPVTLLGHVTKGELRIDDHSYGFIADLKKKVSFAFQNNLKEMASKNNLKPYGEDQGSKKEQVANMFDNIAPKYDFLNHFLSLGIDKLWRKRLVKEVGRYAPMSILDMATGTGDLAIALSKLNPQNIVGLDISVKMVEVGIEKVKNSKLDNVIYLKEGDSENIQFDSNTFDFATVAFGVRNFENPLLGLTEMHRVLKKGGGIAVLEFAMPTKFPIKQLYKFYFFNILPAIGRIFSKDSSAYTYLPESVEAFPSGKKFTDLLEQAGFTKTRIIPLTFGVANIYIGEK